MATLNLSTGPSYLKTDQIVYSDVDYTIEVKNLTKRFGSLSQLTG